MKKKSGKNYGGKVVIYKTPTGPELEVFLEQETIWLTQKQIASLFSVQRPAVTKHLNNIFKSGELVENSVSSILEHTASDGKTYKTQFYALDAVISIGYRINSKQATQFRIWATKTLKNYLIKGYILNDKKLFEEKEKLQKLQETILFLQQKLRVKMLEGQEKEIMELLADYSKTLTVLGEYDKRNLKEIKKEKAIFVLQYAKCQEIIFKLRKELLLKKEAGEIFGNERQNAFESIVKNLYQTFGRKQLYANLETKAAHLLYLTIKDHPFSDGNKRIGSFLFVYFLDTNNYLFRKNGERKINDNALAALALLIAESNPKEKNQMVALITQLLK